MKGSIAHQILRHLYHKDAINENQINVTDFLKKIRDESDDKENNYNRIINAINKIEENKYAIFYFYHSIESKIGIPVFSLDKDQNLDNTSVHVTFLMAGYDYTLLYIRGIEQHNSTIELNDRTIPNNFIVQKNLTLASIIVSCAAALFVLTSVVVSYFDRTPNQLEKINTVMQKHSEILDNILKSQIQINSSLSKIGRDTLIVKTLRK